MLRLYTVDALNIQPACLQLSLAFASNLPMCHVVFSVLLAFALVLARASMLHGCVFAASDTLVSTVSRVFKDQRVRVDRSGVHHEALQRDDVLHVTLRKSCATLRPLVSSLHPTLPKALCVSGSLQSSQSMYLIRSTYQGRRRVKCSVLDLLAASGHSTLRRLWLP